MVWIPYYSSCFIVHIVTRSPTHTNDNRRNLSLLGPGRHMLKNARLHHPSNRQQGTFNYMCSENGEASDIPSNSCMLTTNTQSVKYFGVSRVDIRLVY